MPDYCNYSRVDDNLPLDEQPVQHVRQLQDHLRLRLVCKAHRRVFKQARMEGSWNLCIHSTLCLRVTGSDVLDRIFNSMLESNSCSWTIDR
jgi:hypothetical protein